MDFSISEEDLFAGFAETGTYEVAPSDSTEAAASSSISAIRLTKGNSGGSSEEYTQAAGWLVRASEVTSPKRDDRYTSADGTIWRVRGAEPERAGIWRIYTETGHPR